MRGGKQEPLELEELWSASKGNIADGGKTSSSPSSNRETFFSDSEPTVCLMTYRERY